MFRDKVRSVFASKVFCIIFSIIAACVMWFYMAINDQDASSDYSGVKIQYSGAEALEERGLIVTDINSDKLTLRLSGKKLDIAKINKDDIIVEVDMSGITSAGTHQLQYTINYDAKVNQNNISVTKASVDYVTVNVKKLVTKSVPVRGAYDGEIDEGYVGGALEYTPGMIKISGPEDEVVKVSYAWAVLSKESISKTVSETVPFTLMDAEGTEIVSDNIKAEVDAVQLTMEVSAVRDVPLDVNLIEGAGATAQNTVVEIEPKFVTLSGDAEIMEAMNKLIIGTIDLSSFQTTYTEEMRIVIPDDVMNNSGTTMAKVTVRVVGLDVTKMSVSNIEVINEREGYNTEIITQTLDVTLRSPKEEIAKVEP